MTQLIARFYYFGIYHENLDLSHLDNHTLFQLSYLCYSRESWGRKYSLG